MKTVVIIGAGPAGLTAAYELLEKSKDYKVIVLEETNMIGGISRTVVHNGNRMDMGGHRFFSKVKEVNDWWSKMMPIQGKPSKDDKLLNRDCTLVENGPDPEVEDIVMLKRNRLSRIYFNQKFFDYPISLKMETLLNMGLLTTIIVGFSYLKSMIFKRKENSLEDFYINRFGKKLYSMFFERYTENLWGRHPREISPEWGAQRVKGLSIIAIMKDMLMKLFRIKNKNVETSLIEEFNYPKLGPGQLWELTADKIKEMGGEIRMNTKVTHLLVNKDKNINTVICKIGKESKALKADYVISSMPLKDLVSGLENTPKEYLEIAKGLPYRDYITIGVLVNKLKLKNNTKIRTINNIIPDNWIYIHDKDVNVGRAQIYNNWSPYMIKDIENTVWIGLEYFCNESDKIWNLKDQEMTDLVRQEMIQIGLIEQDEIILDYHIEKIKKAYPAYFDTYEKIDKLRDYLDSISNLYCIGRNGQHRYNNMDHSMCTAFEAVKNIITGETDKSNIWNVNTENKYHESK